MSQFGKNSSLHIYILPVYADLNVYVHVFISNSTFLGKK